MTDRTHLRPLLGALIWVGGGLLILLVLVTMIQTRSLVGATRATQQTNTGTLNNSKATLDRVVDCTTAGHDCFDQQQAQTAKVVGSLNQVTIDAASYAAACANDGVRGAEQIKSCVLAAFEANRKN